MNLKRTLFGESNYDETSARSQKIRDAAVTTGAKFGRWLRLDKASLWLSKQAETKPKVFFGCVFGLILLLLANAGISMAYTISRNYTPASSAIHNQSLKIEEALNYKKARKARVIDSLNIVPSTIDAVDYEVPENSKS